MTDYFVRSLNVTTDSVNQYIVGQVLRLVYELWGYCINGTAALTTPGGMPTTPTSGPVNGFEGTTVLATGSDGATIDGQDTFDSAGASFSPATHLGKYLVVWSPGSPTSENSIYTIIGVPSATQLRVLVANGGTPNAQLRPKLTTRSGLRYRIVDLFAVAGLTWTTSHYLVIQFSPSSINVGQANSQVQFKVGTSASRIATVLSPGGTWTGAAFTDGSSDIVPVTNGSGWYNTGYGVSNFNLIADENSIIVSSNGARQTSGLSSGVHVEIPYRLYTQAQDPNPICACTWGIEALRSDSSTSNYSGYWWMICPDAVTRNHLPLTRSVRGIETDNVNWQGFNSRLDGFHGYNGPSAVAVTSPVLLGHHKTAAQYALGRVQLRRLRMATADLPSYKRVGTNGEWLHTRQGLMFPWDNSILPFNLFQFSF